MCTIDTYADLLSRPPSFGTLARRTAAAVAVAVAAAAAATADGSRYCVDSYVAELLKCLSCLQARLLPMLLMLMVANVVWTAMLQNYLDICVMFACRTAAAAAAASAAADGSRYRVDSYVAELFKCVCHVFTQDCCCCACAC